jgi:glycosyltransferase involved in cell wall biosynthesis
MPQRDFATRPVRLLSVGRLVPKKGHEHQLAACALLQSWGVPFVARIVGDGPLRDELQRRIDRNGLGGLVTLCGVLSPEQVTDEYRWADIFWHTGVVDPDGDRDGLPNVIPEAFAHGLPVISSRTPGAMEAVAHETSGLIVDVSNVSELAGAVKRLAADPALRQRLGENGRRWVEENFLISRNTEVLARAFREASGQ